MPLPLLEEQYAHRHVAAVLVGCLSHLRPSTAIHAERLPPAAWSRRCAVPHYDFNWQLGYEVATSIKVPKGTRFVATAHYDNSPNNKFNPDPARTVYYGNQTWEEMMQPFFGVIVDKNVDGLKVLKRRGPPPTGAE
jgi:hypothetical protein